MQISLLAVHPVFLCIKLSVRPPKVHSTVNIIVIQTELIRAMQGSIRLEGGTINKAMVDLKCTMMDFGALHVEHDWGLADAFASLQAAWIDKWK